MAFYRLGFKKTDKSYFWTKNLKVHWVSFSSDNFGVMVWMGNDRFIPFCSNTQCKCKLIDLSTSTSS